MSELQISIGRDEGADIMISDPTISKLHAVLTIQYYDDITIEDIGSKNGTYINGQKIKKVKLLPNDTLRFGEYQVDMIPFFERIFDLYKKEKIDFSKEFNETLKIFKEYQKQKDSLINQPKGPVYMKVGITVIILAILGFFPDLVPNQNVRFLMMASVGLISVLSSVFGPSVAQKNEALDKLRLQYEDRLVCPKCKTRLIQNNYAYYEGRKKCINDKCNAIYVN